MVKFIPPEINKIDSVVQKKPTDSKIDYAKYTINTEKLWKQYDKWNAVNTGTYTYLCKTNTNGGIYRLLFIKNKKILKSLKILRKRKPNFDIQYIDNSNKTVNILTKRKKFYYNAKDIDFYLLSKRFYQLSNGLSKEYNYFDVDIEYSKKYNYISHMNVTHRELIEYATDISPIIINSYGLLMLPKDIEFTEDIVKKIFKKYRQAWECENQMLKSNKLQSDNNLTLLEKAVGKERLECLDKYLVW